MDKKQLLDKDGNPITREKIEEVFRQLYDKPMKPLLKRCEWEEDDKHYHCWKINSLAGEGERAITGYTNDVGAAQINEAIRKMCEEELGKWKEDGRTMEDRSTGGQDI